MPWTIGLHIFHKKDDDPGYRCVGHKLLSVEESKPAITRDVEGLVVIDQAKIARIIESTPLNLNFTKYDEEYFEGSHIWTKEEMNALGMKREILREWKEYEDWYYSTWLPSHSSHSSSSSSSSAKA